MFNTTLTNYLLHLLLLLFAGYTAIAQTRPQKVFTSATVRDTVYIEGGKVVYHERISTTGALPGAQPGLSQPPTRNAARGATSNAAAPLLISAISTPSTCNRPTGVIAITATGGTPPYTYNLDGSIYYQSSSIFFVPGGYSRTVGVKDALGATATTTIAVGNNNVMPAINIQSYVQPTGCATRDGSITVAASGGTPPYTYSLDGVTYQSANIFSGLAQGDYHPWVKDANGCTNVNSYFFAMNAYGCSRPANFSGTFVSCTNQGSITFTPLGTDAPFMFSTDGLSFQSSNTFNNLPPGYFTVYIKGNSGQVALWGIAITPGCNMVLTSTVTNASCGLTNGIIDVSVSQGAAPFQYSIDGINFQSSNVFTGLPPGNYSVTVRDAFDDLQAVFNVVEDDCPQVTTVVTDALCGASDGVITASPKSGVSPYTYSIDGGTNYQASPVFSGLAPNTYTVMIKDARAITSSTQATVKDRCTQFTLTPSSTTCGNRDGSIVVNVTNGTAPFEYTLDGSTWQSSPIFNGLASGNYSVTVKDNTSFTITKPVTVANIAGPGIQVTPQPAGCNGLGGSLTITGTGGTGPYTYAIDGGIQYQASNQFSNLKAGDYTVLVKDANQCTAVGQVKIVPDMSNTPTLTANTIPAGCGNNDGSIQLQLAGGTAPFEFSLYGTLWQQDPSFSNLASGNYMIRVRDARGCLNNQPISVPFVNTVTLEAGNDLTICEGKSITLPVQTNASAGAFSWTPAAGLDNAQAWQPKAAPTVTTKYYVTLGIGICQVKDSVVVNVHHAPVADAGDNITICSGKSIQLNGSGGAVYHWQPATYLDDATVAGPVVQSPVRTTTYYLSVTDANHCTSLAEDAVTVTVTPPGVIFAGKDTAIMARQPLPLYAQDVNRSGFTSYSWSPATGLDNASVQAPVATLNNDITYKVKGTTPEGCVGEGAISIKVYQVADIFVPNAFSPNGDRNHDTFKAIPIGMKSFKYLMVFNRFGEQVFFTSRAERGWDGLYRGALQTGTFVWVAAGFDLMNRPVQRRGTVTIVR